MTYARDLISDRVVLATPEQRLADVAGQIEEKNALYCAVVDLGGDFLGLVRLSDVALKSADRIFADLIGSSSPIRISDTLEGDMVIKLLQAQGCEEIVVLSKGRRYVGLVTRESVFGWWSRQRQLG